MRPTPPAGQTGKKLRINRRKKGAASPETGERAPNRGKSGKTNAKTPNGTQSGHGGQSPTEESERRTLGDASGQQLRPEEAVGRRGAAKPALDDPQTMSAVDGFPGAMGEKTR